MDCFPEISLTVGRQRILFIVSISRMNGHSASLTEESLTEGVSLAVIETLGLISSHTLCAIKKRHHLMNKQQQHQQIDGRRKTEKREKTTQAMGEEHNNCVIYPH